MSVDISLYTWITMDYFSSKDKIINKWGLV